MDQAYVFKNRPEILALSSSGGAFLGIVNTFLNNMGTAPKVIYGASFDKEFHVKHSAATTLRECYPFCGSKYVRSDLDGCYQKILADLMEGRSVLFTGTPCQVAAVKKYVGKNHGTSERLYTVDIACHGTPKPEFWRDYTAYLEKKEQAKLVKYSFRHKPSGWKGYPVYAEFSNGVKRINTARVSSYMNLFRKNLLMNEGCFKCRYPGNFQSDLTIADFWGVELCMPEIETKGGVSLILSHTEKGEEILSLLKAQCTDQELVFEAVPGEEYLKYNRNLSECTKRPEQYNEFWEDYQKFGMEFVLKKYGGDNILGRCKFYMKRFLRNTGMLAVIKKVLRKA